MNRKDLPRCKTCKHYLNTGANFDGGWICQCPDAPDVFLTTGDINKDGHPEYGCIYHSDYDEPETQTETVQRRAREIIEAREPEIDVTYLRDWRESDLDIYAHARTHRVHFPTEQSRDEGCRRARRAAMEYSLWAQIPRYAMMVGDAAFVIERDGNRVVECVLEDTEIIDSAAFVVYRTREDAQRVADILKREGV